jgi:hypothetical protein
VPFLKFSRDKRGYENIYLVHAQNRRGKPSRPRILYWYRTPPGIRVGRPPFDDETRKRLEAQNPEVTFDWATIVATPIPPPAENEQWRERRRAERAAKQAQRAEEADSMRDVPPLLRDIPVAIDLDEPPTTGDEALESLPSTSNEVETIERLTEPQQTTDSTLPAETVSPSLEAVAVRSSSDRRVADPAARRRRRRGGRRRRGQRPLGPASAEPSVESGNPVEATAPDRSIEPSFDSGTFESDESNDE